MASKKKGAMMNTVEKVSQQTWKLSEAYQNEVLDFVEFLVNKTKTQSNSMHEEKEEQEWCNFSLSQQCGVWKMNISLGKPRLI